MNIPVATTNITVVPRNIPVITTNITAVHQEYSSSHPGVCFLHICVFAVPGVESAPLVEYEWWLAGVESRVLS